MADITDKEIFRELLANIRHYSTLRFAMLTVFVAINGGLFAVYFDCNFASANPAALKLFKAAGIILSLIFFTFERALDHNLTDYWETVSLKLGKHHAFVANRTDAYRFLVPLATHGIYVVTILFWYFYAGDYYPCQAPESP